MVLTQPTLTEITRTSPVIPTGGDCGAGANKVVFGSGSQQIRVRTPSKLFEVTDELHDVLTSKEGGHFYYHDGDRDDLKGKEFLTGTLASWKAPTTHIKLSDDPALKVEYALQMLLGALGTLPHRPEWNLHLVLSIHNSRVFGAPLKDKVQGNHLVSFRGKDTPRSRVKLNVSLVVPEGGGSYAQCCSFHPPLIDLGATAIAIDGGTSTMITTVFAPGGAIIHRKVLEVGGCIDLLDAIAADPDLISFLGKGKAGSVETIRQNIENGTFQYGSRPFNFKFIYDRHLNTWFNDRIRLCSKEIEEWRDAAQSLVAWGGFVEMPGVVELLVREGFSSVREGSWANAMGLQRIAEGRLARGK